jgi:Ni/Fe-hydrogenase subunit HybB-like protein
MEPTPAHPNRTAKLALGLLAAFAGGLVGHFAFLWIARQGFYALALPGALAGLGCGLVSKQNCFPVAFACGGWALALGIFSEWRFAPFTKDAGLGYFLTHLQDLRPTTLMMILLGGVFGFWFALGRRGKISPASTG